MRVLKKLFGPSINEVWSKLSEETGAQFHKGGLWKGSSKVVAQVGNWTLTLDTYTVSTGKSSVTFTRLRLPFASRDGFRFTIYRKTIMSAVGKFFGMQDIEVGGPKLENPAPLFGVPGYLDPQIIETGYPEFDRDFIIKSNDEAKAASIFKRLKVRETIESQSAILFKIQGCKELSKRHKRDDIDELYFQVTGIIKDIERLKSLFALFRETIETLHQTGSASEERLS